MRPRCFCSSLPAGLLFGVFVFLLRPVSTQKIRNQIYFLDNEGDIVLKGPDNPGSDIVVWEWEPHSGPGKQTVVTLRVVAKNNDMWSRQWGKGWGNAGKNQEVDVDLRTGNLAITKARFKWSGLFTLTETHPRNQILKQYEIYGIKVEASPQNPLLGSDVTLSCTISRLSDTVSLHWRPMDSSQQNRSNTDQIRLDNTVYLMVRHVTVEDGKLYVCDVRENGNIVHTSNGDFTVNTRNHNFTFRFVVFIGGLAVLLVIILAVEFWQRKRKPTGLGNQRQPTPPSKRNTEGESHLYGNVEEIRQVAEGEGEDGRVDEEP